MQPGVQEKNGIKGDPKVWTPKFGSMGLSLLRMGKNVNRAEWGEDELWGVKLCVSVNRCVKKGLVLRCQIGS